MSAFDVESGDVVNEAEVNELTEASSASSSAWGRTLFRGGNAGFGDRGGATSVRKKKKIIRIRHFTAFPNETT
jgi:hypothetical protein